MRASFCYDFGQVRGRCSITADDTRLVAPDTTELRAIGKVSAHLTHESEIDIREVNTWRQS